MAPAHAERRSAPEPAHAELSARAELSAYAHEPTRAPRAAAPFDLERDGEQPAVALSALAGPSAPFDLERELAPSARAA
jgi:hypothetical protein